MPNIRNEHLLTKYFFGSFFGRYENVKALHYRRRILELPSKFRIPMSFTVHSLFIFHYSLIRIWNGILCVFYGRLFCVALIFGAITSWLQKLLGFSLSISSSNKNKRDREERGRERESVRNRTGGKKKIGQSSYLSQTTSNQVFLCLHKEWTTWISAAS